MGMRDGIQPPPRPNAIPTSHYFILMLKIPFYMGIYMKKFVWKLLLDLLIFLPQMKDVNYNRHCMVSNIHLEHGLGGLQNP